MVDAKKPAWLRKPIRLSQVEGMKNLLESSGLRTICEEAMCPNIGECFAGGVATFLILGGRCTRACSFCAVEKGKPLPPDPGEPQRLAEAVVRLGLRHVVITSPTRDDLEDGGSEQFCTTVRAIKVRNPDVIVELLIPDMKEEPRALERIAHSGAEIVAHNVETVPRLYHVRRGAEYRRSLLVLKTLQERNPAVLTKSALMLGLGERDDEVVAVMDDLRANGCSYLSIGQYLSPSPHHEKVVEYVLPERFAYFRNRGLEMGFAHVKSSPYTRSSYMAHEYRAAKGSI